MVRAGCAFVYEPGGVGGELGVELGLGLGFELEAEVA